MPRSTGTTTWERSDARQQAPLLTATCAHSRGLCLLLPTPGESPGRGSRPGRRHAALRTPSGACASRVWGRESRAGTAPGRGRREAVGSDGDRAGPRGRAPARRAPGPVLWKDRCRGRERPRRPRSRTPTHPPQTGTPSRRDRDRGRHPDKSRLRSDRTPSARRRVGDPRDRRDPSAPPPPPRAHLPPAGSRACGAHHRTAGRGGAGGRSGHVYTGAEGGGIGTAPPPPPPPRHKWSLPRALFNPRRCRTAGSRPESSAAPGAAASALRLGSPRPRGRPPPPC